MNVKVVRIGNSRGVRIPKRVLDQCQISDAVELRVEERHIILEPIDKKPRDGWLAAAAQMHETGDDSPLLPDVFEDDIEVDWQ